MTTPLDRLLNHRLHGSANSLPDDDGAQKEMPTLWSFLTRKEVDEKTRKEPATISIRLGLGAWLVTLTDQSLEVSMQTTCPTLAGCLGQLEKACRDPNAPWSPWRKSKGKFDRVNARSSGHEETGSVS